MVGGGNRKDEGSFTVSNSNVFAVLERRKKKSDKEKGSTKSTKSVLKAGAGKSKEPEEEKPQVFWAPAPLTVKSWADVDDEDDDDYYATTAPLQSAWGVSGSSKPKESQKPEPVEVLSDPKRRQTYDQYGEEGLKDMPSPYSIESPFGFRSSGAARSMRFSSDRGGPFGGFSMKSNIFRNYSGGIGASMPKNPPRVESKLPCSLEEYWIDQTNEDIETSGGCKRACLFKSSFQYAPRVGSLDECMNIGYHRSNI